MNRYSHSQIALYRSCPLRFFYRIDLGLERRDVGVESHHLVFGAAMHEALAFLYQNQYWQGDIPWKLALKEKAQQIFLERYPTQLDQLDRAKTRANGMKALELYVSHYAFEDHKWKVLQVEQVDLDADDWQLHLDLVVETERGEVYGIDHKFVGGKESRYLPETFWQGYEIDSQVTQYIDQIEKKYGRCDGFYINAIALRSVQRERASATPYAEYSSLGDDGYILKVRFGRQLFNRTYEQVEQEWWSVDQAIEAIEKARRDMALGVPSHRAYGFYSNSCRYCEYRGVCTAGWSWERDSELIQIQYRRVCGQAIPEKCIYCQGEGRRGYYPSGVEPYADDCDACHATGKHLRAGHRCTLDLAHAGPCDDPPRLPTEELEVEVED